MKNNNYSKAYVEVLEILKCIPKKDRDKIPQNIIEIFEKNKDLEWEFRIDYDKPFEGQIILPETKAILANISRDYWANDHQRKVIKAHEEMELKKIEEEKRKIYNPDNIFTNKSNIKYEKQKELKNELPAEIPKKTFIEKFIYKIKKIFARKNNL